jgi:hypothetical protein
MEKHFVNFLSPGTFVAEETTNEIESWDIDKAVAMSKEIEERHGTLPYGFFFTTRTRTDADLDSKVTAKSNMYYLGGTVLTLEEIKAQNDPADRILIRNMECNGWSRVIVNTNSWKWTQPLNDGDVVLEMEN